VNKPDFIQAYLDWAGESECPAEYLKWSALSLMAAACGNRIYTTRQIGSRVVRVMPNLYIILVGPSGNFKSFALSCVREILSGCNYRGTLNLYDGHVTASGMFDAMKTTVWTQDAEGNRTKVERPWKKHFYLLNDELANDVGSIDFADMFVKALTRMYLLTPFDDRTRTSGHVHIEDYSLNWFAATTADWLIKSITKDALLAGFLSRVIMVNQGYTGRRIWEGRRHANWSGLYEFLVNRIDELMVMQGCVSMTDDAIRVAKSWYLTREDAGKDDPTMGSWRRQYDMSLKLSLLLALARFHTKIDDDDLTEAQEMTEQIVSWQKEVVPDIIRGQRNTHEMTMLNLIRARSTVKRSILSKYAYDRFGMRSSEVDQLVRTWIDANFIAEVKRPRSKGGVHYVSTGR
jgi:hypothetical protein